MPEQIVINKKGLNLNRPSRNRELDSTLFKGDKQQLDVYTFIDNRLGHCFLWEYVWENK